MRVERRLAALALALAALGAQAAELGTLFHTPQERERLDRLRRGEPEVVVARRPPALITGIVKRSDGRNTVWIDGKPMAAGKDTPLPDLSKLREPREGGAIEIRRSR